MKYRLSKIVREALTSVIYIAFLLFSSLSHSRIESIENIEVEVEEEISCSICLELAEEHDNYPASPDCCQHIACYKCLTQLKPKDCPECRQPFQYIKHRQDITMHEEHLICPGCQQKWDREEINEHLKSCPHNRQIYKKKEDEARKRCMEHLKSTPPKTNIIDKDGASSMLHTSRIATYTDENAIFECRDDLQLQGISTDECNFFYYKHQIFADLIGPPSIAIIQVMEVDQVLIPYKELLTASCHLGECQYATLHPPHNMMTLLKAEEKMKVSSPKAGFYHTFVAVQEKKEPLTLEFILPSKKTESDINNPNTNFFLLYAVNVPAQTETHWGIQELKYGHRIMIEMDKDYHVLTPSPITHEEERKIEAASGESIRSDQRNSLEVTFFILTCEEGNEQYLARGADHHIYHQTQQPLPMSQQNTATHRYRHGEFSCTLTDPTNANVPDSASKMQNSPFFEPVEVDSPPFSTQATFKQLSTTKLANTYQRSAIHSIPRKSLTLFATTKIFVDVVYSGFPVTASHISNNLRREIAEQQQKTHQSVKKE